MRTSLNTVNAIGAAALLAAAGSASAQVFDAVFGVPSLDRWMYPFNSTPGTETRAPVFGAILIPGFDDRDSQFLVGFQTSEQVPAGRERSNYRIASARVRATVSATTEGTFYDPTPDSIRTLYPDTDPEYLPDSDPGKPVDLFGVGFRNGVTLGSFQEFSFFGCAGFPVEGCRSVYAADYDANGTATDVSRQVRTREDIAPWAVGTTASLNPGDVLEVNTELTFEIDLCRPGVREYLQEQLRAGKVMFAITSLHPADGGPGGGGGDYPSFYTKEAPGAVGAGRTAKFEVLVRIYEGADFNGDGQVDFFDYLDFVQAFGAESPEADFNGDCQVDFFDYLDFVQAFGE